MSGRPPVVRDACLETLAYLALTPSDSGITSSVGITSSRSVAYVMRAYEKLYGSDKDPAVWRFLRTLEQLAAFDGFVEDTASLPLRELGDDLHRSTARHELCALQELRAHLEWCLLREVDIRGRRAATRDAVKKVVQRLLTHDFD